MELQATNIAASRQEPLRHALYFESAGFSVIPIRLDGTKAPQGPWKAYQRSRAGRRELYGWFNRSEPFGVALVHGAISGNSEAIDVDLAEIAQEFRSAACREIPALVDAPWIETPRPGYQLIYRNNTPPSGNLKLAELPNPEWNEGVTRVPKWKTKIETRGEGGYTVTCGSPPRCHPTNQIYRFAAGSFRAIPILTAEERARLHDIARSFDERSPGDERDHRNLHDEALRLTGDGGRPGDRFNRNVNWDVLLRPHGWTFLYSSGVVGYWRRPGKKEQGASATTNYGGHGLFYVFSSNASPFEADRGYTGFAVFGLLEHGGDFGAAARQLCRWMASR